MIGARLVWWWWGGGFRSWNQGAWVLGMEWMDVRVGDWGWGGGDGGCEGEGQEVERG